MGEVGLFLLVLLLMLLGAIAFLIPLLSRRNFENTRGHAEVNVAIYQDKLRDIEADLRNKTLSESDYHAAEQELKRQLLADTDTAEESYNNNSVMLYRILLILVITLPLVSGGIYLLTGHPEIFAKQGKHPPMHGGGVVAKSEPTKKPDARTQALHSLIGKMEKSLKKKPEDHKTRLFLARAYQRIGRYTKAIKEYRKIYSAFKTNPDYLADYADALVVIHGGQPQKKAIQLVTEALAINPNHVKALHLMGTVYYRRGEYTKAAQLWKKILPQVKNERDYRKLIENIIAQAEQKAQATSKSSATTAGQAKPSNLAGASPRLTGVIKLSDDLKGKIKGNPVVFLFAKPAAGGRMPLAGLKLRLNQLPYRFTLTNANAMMDRLNLSSTNKVRLTARVAISNKVKAQPGDYEGESNVVPVTESRVIMIIINKRL